MKIFSIKKCKDKKTIQILGIQIYKKTIYLGETKRIYLGGLFKTKFKNYKKKYYFLGIKIFSKKDKYTELKNSIIKKIDNIYYNMQVEIKAPFVHSYFLKYKNCNIGKDVILFAGGPTFKYYNNEIKNAVKCGVNGIIALIDDLDYLIVEDIFLYDKNLNNELDNYKGNNCTKFYGILPPRRIRTLNKYKHSAERITPLNIYNSKANIFLIEDVAFSKWAVDLEYEPIGDFAGAALSALQILAYTNPKRIFLVGNDCSDETLAYHSDRPANSKHSNKIVQYLSFKKFAEKVYPNIEIISVNPVGLRGMFKDVYTQNYIDANPHLLDQNINIINNESDI